MPDRIIFDYTENTSPNRTDNVLLQENASALYTRATIANILGQLQSSDIPDISGTYAKYIPQSNIYYVGKHGNDTENGLTIEKAFLTFSAAMSVATSGDAIVCFDGGTYNEGITCKDGVNIFAPNATLNVTGSQLIMATSTIYFDKITRDSGGNAMILFDGATGRQKIIANVVDDLGSNIALRFTFTSIPIIDIKELYVSGGGIGIADFTQAIHGHGTLKDLYLNSNGAIGLQVNGTGNLEELDIQHIVDLGFTNTIAIDSNTGVIDLICQRIVADTVADIEEGATVNLIGCSYTGTVLNDGTFNRIVADNNLPDDNVLINPSFTFIQRQTNPSTATTYDDTEYSFDRWKVLSEASNSIQAQRVDGINARYAGRFIQNNSTAQQYGIVQYIEGINCRHLRGKKVTLSGYINANSNTTVKAVIVQWNSTEDTITNDMVSTWNSTLTLATNFTRAGTEKSISITSGTNTYFEHTVTLNSSFNNLAILFYVPNNEAQNNYIQLENIKLQQGYIATPYIPRKSSVEKALCDYYYEKIGTTANADILAGSVGVAVNTTEARIPFTFTFKRVSPSITSTTDGFDVIPVVSVPNDPVITFSTITQRSTRLVATITGTLNDNGAIYLRQSSSVSEAYIFIDAEL